MADTSNNLTFFVQSSIIDDYDLRVAAYQRLILDNDVGISQLVNETTRMQDKKLKQQMQKEKTVAQISLDQIQKKLKKLELQKKQRPMIVSEETEKIMQENVRNKDKLNKIREILGEESEDEIVNVQQERQEDFDLEASNVDFTTKKNVDMSSYIANYGMNKFDYFEKHALSDRDYNLSMIAQPYRSVAYYTHQKIAVPPSYWCFRGKKKEFQVNLCRLQRRWSITSSPMDKVAFLRHAIVSYYTLADLNPLLEQFKIEEELQLKDLGDLFADLQLQKQINEAVAPMKNETKLTLEPSGATLEDVNFLNLNEFNTITVEPPGGGQNTAYRIRELYATKENKGYIVKKDEEEFFFYMEDSKLKSRELKQGFELLEALLKDDEGMLEKPKEVLADIRDITVDKKQSFEEYMQKSIEATLEWDTKQSNTKDTVGVKTNLGINFESIDNILKAVNELKKKGYVKIQNKEIVSGTFVKGSGLGTAKSFIEVAKQLKDEIEAAMKKKINDATDFKILKKVKNSGIKVFSKAASARINKLLQSDTIFEVLSYVPRINRFAFLQNYGVLLVGFQMVTSEINAVLNKKYEDNTKKIDAIFKNDKDILNLYQNFSVENLSSIQAHALAHFYYDEKTFLRANFGTVVAATRTNELMQEVDVDDDEDIENNFLQKNDDDNEVIEVDEYSSGEKETQTKRKRKAKPEGSNKKSKPNKKGTKRKRKPKFESAGADLNDLVKDNKTVRSKIEEYLNNEQVLDDLQKQLNKTDEDAVTKVMQDLSKIIELVRWSDLDEEDREAYLKKILVKRLFVKGNCGMIPFLCTFGESAVLKYISSMKKYLKNGLSMARQGEYQNFYAENYKDFYNKNKNWENGVKRFNEYRKYKYNIDPHMLQNDRHILACVLENPLNLSAERDFISLESLKPATNWTTIVRMALYEKYNFFMPLLSDTLGGKIFDELVARNAFHDFVYNYCTLYTLIFNDYN